MWYVPGGRSQQVLCHLLLVDMGRVQEYLWKCGRSMVPIFKMFFLPCIQSVGELCGVHDMITIYSDRIFYVSINEEALQN